MAAACFVVRTTTKSMWSAISPRARSRRCSQAKSWPSCAAGFTGSKRRRTISCAATAFSRGASSLLQLRYDPHSLRERYTSADPFPHIVIDGLVEDAALQRVLDEFPKPDETRWMTFDSPTEKKLGYYHEHSTITPTVRSFLDAMNGFEMLLFLEALTGIEGLIPDPYFGGGGLHQLA